MARLTLLLNYRHLLAQASGEGMMVPAEVPFWNVFVRTEMSEEQDIEKRRTWW